jgi:hypothetical protein
VAAYRESTVVGYLDCESYGQISQPNSPYGSVSTGSVAEGFIATAYSYAQPSQLSPESNFSTSSYFDQENPQLNESFDSLSSPGSNLSGSATSQLNDALMDSMSPPSSQDQVKNAKLKNDHAEKKKKSSW